MSADLSAPARQVDVAIVGGGPAGLAAAIELRRRGVARVLVVERESEAGGIPRHADHIGFGWRDLRRLLSGPRYARRYVELARRAGVELQTSTTATDWAGGTALALTGPNGVQRVVARAVLLATGCRERPRSARWIAGDRPFGVFTTGSLQQLVVLQRQRIGRRAIVVGAEHVSFSAVLTLARGGASTVALVTDHPAHQTHALFKWLSATRLGVPVWTSQRVTRVLGRRRVEAVEVSDLRTGATRRVECDTVVFTGDWIPDHELARRGELDMDAGTHGPRVDGALRTSQPGVFAAGNLVHAAETADIAALGGRHAAIAVQRHVDGGAWPQRPPVPILCAAPVQWVSPSAVAADEALPARGRFVWRVAAFLEEGDLVIRQGERILSRTRHRRMVPSLPLRAPTDWVRSVDPRGAAIVFELCSAKSSE